MASNNPSGHLSSALSQSISDSHFEPNAILRGAQLTMVGAYRALQNPSLFKHGHYRQAAFAVGLGVVIQLVISIPVLLARATIALLSLFVDLERQSWDEKVIEGLGFVQNSVLQVPFFLMTLMKHVSPAMDELFMESLDWVDRTYMTKHRSEDPTHLRALYYPNLRLWEAEKSQRSTDKKGKILGAIKNLGLRYGRKAAISLVILLLSAIPYVGKLVLPAASFYTFRKHVGTGPALVIFGTGIFLPRRYVIQFLQTFFSSRHLMRELLQPYFSRVKFDGPRKKAWLKDREGVLFGFGVGFFLLIKIPLVGVLIYGIAEASTAFLITKITDPPPPPSSPADKEAYISSQARWANKKAFLSLSLANLDAANVDAGDPPPPYTPRAADLPRKKFT